MRDMMSGAAIKILQRISNGGRGFLKLMVQGHLQRRLEKSSISINTGW